MSSYSDGSRPSSPVSPARTVPAPTSPRVHDSAPRTSQDTVRTKYSDHTPDIVLSPAPELAPVHKDAATDAETLHNGRHTLDEDEDVWEDEEDSILMDQHGNIVYEGPDYEDSASESSDDQDAQELSHARRSYRQATQQYRQSRRALLLSGLSSFASSPSSDDLGSVSRTEHATSVSPPGSIFETSASPPGSIFETSRTDRENSYYQPHTAESVDTADAGGRAHSIRYTSEPPSGGELAANGDPQSDTAKGEADLRSSSEGEEDTFIDSRAIQTPRFSLADPMQTNGQLPASPIKRESGCFERPALSPRSTSTHHDLPDAYMTPRLSLAQLQEEPRMTASPLATEKEPELKKESQPQANGDAHTARADNTPFSLWDYLKEEVLATDFDATQEMKWERVTNFISIPFWMEKIIMFGFVVCLDSFLYTFTILPLRFGVALWTWLTNTTRWMLGGQKRYLHSSHKCDLLKMLLIVSSCVILSRITDASKMYHSVRGQDVVKLSVIFNVLEIADRLCCSFGQDLLDSLFSRSTLARRKNGKQPYLRPVGFFGLSLCYVLAHTLVLFYQLVTLNVAINSYDNALLTLLLSNQFVEIKSSVFKKFEKENVFQMTCADIVERFQLTFMLSAIGLRNLIELSGGSLEPSASPLPASFTVFPSLSLLETVLTPVLIVLASECIVDWLKHAFITKFNHIRPAVYGRFMDVLCRDLVVGGPSMRENSRKHTFVDQSPIISRRLGFAALPLACLLVRLILQIIGMIGDTSHIDECIAPVNPRISETSWIGVVARKLGAVDINNEWVRALDLFVRGSAWALTAVIAWAFLVAIKLLIGTNLVSFASHRYASMHERENEEALNSRDRAPIGTNKDERSYDKSLGRFIDRPDDDAVQIKLDGSHVLPAAKEREKSKVDSAKPKKETSLMEVSRYNMIRSRIW
ncbi:DUF747 family protein [Moesziomyces antarcticus]|uniref:DUF747 family protein n=1 Tax=Pseudozyma antarctica TaxID=84753 RepID=A0A081CN81_PSEA2|nr:DUF747 family protein [Moesziomyces antarcticus]GAK68127.1 DUF747 family protein [Moesziomyces antarcticus]